MFRVASLIAGGTALVMMLLTAVDVIGRYFLHKPLTGTVEVSAYLMVVMVFLAAAGTQASGRTARVELLTVRFSESTRRWLEAFILLLLLGLGLLFTWKTGQEVYRSWRIGEYESQAMPLLRIWPTKAFLTAGFLLLSIEFLLELGRHLKALVRPRGNGG